VHWLVPVHVDVQFELHDPSHVDFAEQFVVQPVPHVESQVFCESHLYVTLFGGGAAPPSPPSAAPASVPPAPKVHVPPCLQVHTFPVHSQAPVHAAVEAEASAGISLLPSLPPQPIGPPEPKPMATATIPREPTMNRCPSMMSSCPHATEQRRRTKLLDAWRLHTYWQRE
jgi:hypothetical protein